MTGSIRKKKNQLVSTKENGFHRFFLISHALTEIFVFPFYNAMRELPGP
jgi:hypothetical protein